VTVGSPWQWGVVDAAAAVRDRSITPIELLDSVLGRIDAVEPGHVDRSGATKGAEQLEVPHARMNRHTAKGAAQKSSYFPRLRNGLPPLVRGK
jgi:hypothetical protein